MVGGRERHSTDSEITATSFRERPTANSHSLRVSDDLRPQAALRGLQKTKEPPAIDGPGRIGPVVGMTGPAVVLRRKRSWRYYFANTAVLHVVN
jgi:hypothetical protein